jgi:hypothetical protein
MHGAQRILRHLAENGVDLVLSGHLHRTYRANSLDLCAEHPPGRGVRIAQAGTATSARGRGAERNRNSFNLICVDRTAIRITPHLYFDDLDAFAPISQHLYPRAGRWPGTGAASGTGAVHDAGERQMSEQGG